MTEKKTKNLGIMRITRTTKLGHGVPAQEENRSESGILPIDEIKKEDDDVNVH